MVRTNTAVLPGADAAVVRIKETRRALAMSLDGNGNLRRLIRGRRETDCRRSRAKRRLRRRAADRDHKLSEFRFARTAGSDVGVFRSHRRNSGSLRGVRNAGRFRQRLVLQRNRRTRNFADADHRNGRFDRRRAKNRHAGF